MASSQSHSQAQSQTQTPSSSSPSSQPVSIVCVGMAGSGKTTFMQRINAHLHQHNSPPYVVNLDPAVHKVPFQSNIDIRDTVNYKEVMKQYKLGPNGGILTSLNLFATKVHQVIDILEKRTKEDEKIKHVIVDTPGQIEVFVWSASGDIILGSLATAFPTVIAYIIDTPRSASTSTFMSNMLYACSILYKTKLPMILVFNKADVHDPSFAEEWMTDFEAFQAALRQEEETGQYGGLDNSLSGEEPAAMHGFAGQGSGYMGSLLHSMSLVLDEFYKHLKVVGVSAVTGQGIDAFFEAVQEKKEEFDRDYKPEMERRRAQREKIQKKVQEKQLGKMMRDMAVDDDVRQKGERDTVSDVEEMDDSDDEENDDDERKGGLEGRYQRALRDETDSSRDQDISFVKYLQKSNIG